MTRQCEANLARFEVLSDSNVSEEHVASVFRVDTMRFEVVTAIDITIIVVWEVTPCSFGVRY
jgi:hypothetical protein